MEQLLRTVDDQDEALTAYTPAGEPVTLGTKVVLVDDDNEDPPAGTRYLLEIALMQEVLDVWRGDRDDAEPTAQQALDAVVYYAIREDHQPAGDLAEALNLS
jgi:hypothetical protein